MLTASFNRADRQRAEALRAIRSLIGAMGRSARSIEWRTGFTNAQLFLLRQLSTAESMSVNELAERAATNQSTVSSVLGRIVRAGLVSHERSPDDGRRAVLSLTPKGRRMLGRAPTPPTEALLNAIKSLSDRDARALNAWLTALLAALGVATEDAPMLFEEGAPRGPAIR
jgi:MarR family transcriptional regulator, organic hydroperoxide resistance regulator